jgi:uncharacterized membrane protein
MSVQRENLMATSTDFGSLINRATTLWKDNLGDLTLLSLVFLLVCWIPVANVGFIAGYTRALLKVTRGGKAQVGDIFSSWDCFGNLFVYLLLLLLAIFVLGHIPFFGAIATYVLYIAVTPGIYVVIDRNMKALDAVSWSFSLMQADFISWMLVVLIGSILSSVGIIALGIGVVLTLPWGYLAIIQQYELVPQPS